MWTGCRPLGFSSGRPFLCRKRQKLLRCALQTTKPCVRPGAWGPPARNQGWKEGFEWAIAAASLSCEHGHGHSHSPDFPFLSCPGPRPQGAWCRQQATPEGQQCCQPHRSRRPRRQQAVARASSQHQPVRGTRPPDKGQGADTGAAQDLRDRQHSRDRPAQLFLPVWKHRPRERRELLQSSPCLHDVAINSVMNNETVKIYEHLLIIWQALAWQVLISDF